MIMLDTNIVSELRDRRRPLLNAWFARLGQDLCLSAISVSELQFGAASVSPRKPSFATELDAWLDEMLATMRIIPLDAEAARLLGRMQAVDALRLALAPPSAPRFGSDLGIAATAIIAEAQVATLNLRDFRLIARHFPALVVTDPLRA